jgi:hypothetical protein
MRTRVLSVNTVGIVRMALAAQARPYPNKRNRRRTAGAHSPVLHGGVVILTNEMTESLLRRDNQH